MSENIFEKFNSMMDINGLKKDIEDSANKSGDYVEVPHGDYEVKVVKLEIGETGEKSKNPGSPMAKIWYEILTGEFKNQKIFQNQMLTTGFGVHKMNELLNSFETDTPVVFEDFKQYADLFAQIFTEIDGRAEYQLSYTANKKNPNFSDCTIVARFYE